MAFIFTPEHDPRGEQMATEFNAGAKVKYRGMTMPAEVLSGPHKSPGRDRYLIRKADGNVSLVHTTDLERITPRVVQMARSLALNVFGSAYESLDCPMRLKVASAALRALEIADDTRGQA